MLSWWCIPHSKEGSESSDRDQNPSSETRNPKPRIPYYLPITRSLPTGYPLATMYAPACICWYVMPYISSALAEKIFGGGSA